MQELFKGQEVTIDGADVPVTGLAYDSREVTPGVLFAALVGVESDGHGYIARAVEGGATSVLCERDVDTGSATRVLSGDARRSLALAARVFFDNPSAKHRSVGITGPNGKTTSAPLIAEVLRAGGLSSGIIGTLGVQYNEVSRETGFTTPESVELLRLLQEMVDAGVAGVVMEVSSHALSQRRVAGVEFDVGVFTNLTQDHLDYHESLDAYFEAKALLFRRNLKETGVGVVNLDDPRVATLMAPGMVGFSTRADSGAAVWLKDERHNAEGMMLQIETPRGVCALRSSLVGDFNVENILAAVATGVALDVSLDQIAAGVGRVPAVPGRLERVSVEGGASLPLVLVDYAHTPDALEKALKALRGITKGRLICVFGCGGDRDASKRGPMGAACAAHADWSVVTSDNPRTEDPETIAAAVVEGLEVAGARRGSVALQGGYEVELERERAIELAIESAGEGDCVLIAGKGHEQYQIIGKEKRWFDDREQGYEVLKSLNEG